MVFLGYLDELFLPGFSIQRLLLDGGQALDCTCLQHRRVAFAANVRRLLVAGFQGRVPVLEDIGHLFKQNSVFTFDLGVSV